MSEPTEREWLEGLRYEDKFACERIEALRDELEGEIAWCEAYATGARSGGYEGAAVAHEERTTRLRAALATDQPDEDADVGGGSSGGLSPRGEATATPAADVSAPAEPAEERWTMRGPKFIGDKTIYVCATDHKPPVPAEIEVVPASALAQAIAERERITQQAKKALDLLDEPNVPLARSRAKSVLRSALSPQERK